MQSHLSSGGAWCFCLVRVWSIVPRRGQLWGKHTTLHFYERKIQPATRLYRSIGKQSVWQRWLFQWRRKRL